MALCKCYLCREHINTSRETYYYCGNHSRDTLENKYHYIPGYAGGGDAVCVCASCGEKKLEGSEFWKVCPVCKEEGIDRINHSASLMSIGNYYK